MANSIPKPGILLLDKNRGPTSHDLVASLRRLLGIRRIGHSGTLDPMASGLMVMCVGNFTRLNPWLTQADKTYEATVKLGATSNTDDDEGVISPYDESFEPSLERVECVLDQFRGEIEQIPPSFSAIKIGGVRSHKLAREGKRADLSPRNVHILHLTIQKYAFPLLEIGVHCSKGTYIRALARDIGRELGCGGYLTALRRTGIGSMVIENALTMQQIEEHQVRGTLPEQFLSPRSVLQGVEHIELSERSQMERFGHGNTVDLGRETFVGDCAVYHPNGDLCGMGKMESGRLKPTVVLATPTAI
jgi:tRNA pseudouridine55 synthase